MNLLRSDLDCGEVAKTFSREEIGAEIEELRSYQALAESIQKNSKGEALLIALEKAFVHNRPMGQPEKAVIFTESRRTQQYLFRLLSHIRISFLPTIWRTAC
jgi:hypothetical protein